MSAGPAISHLRLQFGCSPRFPLLERPESDLCFSLPLAQADQAEYHRGHHRLRRVLDEGEVHFTRLPCGTRTKRGRYHHWPARSPGNPNYSPPSWTMSAIPTRCAWKTLPEGPWGLPFVRRFSGRNRRLLVMRDGSKRSPKIPKHVGVDVDFGHRVAGPPSFCGNGLGSILNSIPLLHAYRARTIREHRAVENGPTPS
jgi:hypothetical protein